MQVKRALAVLLILLCYIIFSAYSCMPSSISANSAAVDPPSLGVTPADTSAGTLDVTVKISEDQDSTDGKSVIAFTFRTMAIEEGNYAIFDNKEPVVCNTHTLTLSNSPTYTLLVSQGHYTCTYTGNTDDGRTQLPPVTLLDVTQRSELSPHPPAVSSQGYKIDYTPDSGDMACPITAQAKDSSGNVVNGPNSTSNLGVYDGPTTSGLTGEGSILLIRTCSWKYQNAFNEVDLTYISMASVEVTWSH